MCSQQYRLGLGTKEVERLVIFALESNIPVFGPRGYQRNVYRVFYIDFSHRIHRSLDLNCQHLLLTRDGTCLRRQKSLRRFVLVDLAFLPPRFPLFPSSPCMTPGTPTPGEPHACARLPRTLSYGKWLASAILLRPRSTHSHNSAKSLD